MVGWSERTSKELNKTRKSLTPIRVALVRGSWHSVWEPLALGYLYSYTKDLPKLEYIYRGDGAFDTESDIIQGCAEADIVGFSGTTSQMPWSLRIASAIKSRSPDCRIFVGGYGPSVSPEWFIAGSVSIPRGPISGAVVGEGERPWRSILLSGGVQTGVIFEPAIPDLDSIPFPDRDFIKVERCIDVAKREEGRRVTGILGNRGCLRRCRFCADGSKLTIYGVKLRERSPRNIVDEMESVQADWELDFWKAADPEVNTRGGRSEELAREMIERKWNVPWGGNFLASPVREKEAKMLYDAGCREAWIGLESGNLAVHQHIGKGVSPNTIRETFAAFKRAGILRRSYVLIGTPPETKETVADTERLIDEVQPDTISITILAPYPGSQYYDPIKHANLDWSLIDEYGGSNPWASDYLTHQELLDERARLLEKYGGKLAKIMEKKRELGWLGNVQRGVIAEDEVHLTDFSPDDPRS